MGIRHNQESVTACTRRGFLNYGTGTLAAAAVPTSLFSSLNNKKGPVPTLPAAEPDPDDDFGVDLNVNMNTIDDYLGMDGVAYRDMRMLRDPADYASMGGDPRLSFMLEGFTVTPYPYIGTLAKLPVSGAYTGPCLFDVTWRDGLEVADASPNYTQSLQYLEEVFPQDSPIVLMCGGGGYAAMTRALLVYLGWDPSLLINAGGMWNYGGGRLVQLVSYDRNGTPECYPWRAHVATVDFDLLVAL